MLTDSILKAPANWRSNITQEAEDIKKVGLARCVWAYEEGAALQVYINPGKITPVT